jgi:hypothetical protein
MNIILSDNQKAKVKELKKKEGCSQSDIMRKALSNYYRGEVAGEIRLPEGTKAIQISFLK